jgi:hypothetical protein
MASTEQQSVKKRKKQCDHSIKIVVNVNSDSAKGDKKPPRIPMVLATFLIVIAACAITYGQMTGDYAPLRGIAESGKPLIDVVSKLAKEKAA